MNEARKKKATDFITKCLQDDSLYAAWRATEVYRLLTGEMPQSPGLEKIYAPDEMPGVELASPTERDPSRLLYVQAGEYGEPDVIWEEGDHAEKGTGSSLDGAQAHRGAKGLQPPGKSKT